MKALEGVVMACNKSAVFFKHACRQVEHPGLRDWMSQQAVLREGLQNDIKNLTKKDLHNLSRREEMASATKEAMQKHYAVVSECMRETSAEEYMPALVKAEKVLASMLREAASQIEGASQNMLKLRAIRIDEAVAKLPPVYSKSLSE